MEQVLNIIQENSNRTGNISGINLIQIQKKSSLPFQELRKTLQKLINTGKVEVREGINHQLLFAL